MSLNKAFYKVQDFHRAFNHPIAERPTLQSAQRVAKRGDWIVEEVLELDVAETIVDQADAYIDIIYFALGGLVELGVAPGELFDIVHGANMAKLQADGSVAYHPDGKVKKPEGWQAPEPLLAAAVERQSAPLDWALPLELLDGTPVQLTEDTHFGSAEDGPDRDGDYWIEREDGERIVSVASSPVNRAYRHMCVHANGCEEQTSTVIVRNRSAAV